MSKQIFEKQLIKKLEFDAYITEQKIYRFESATAGHYDYRKGTYVTAIKGIFDFPQNTLVDDVISAVQWLGRKINIKDLTEWGNSYGDVVIIPDKTQDEYLIEMTIGTPIMLPPCNSDEEAFSIFNATIKILKIKYGEKDVFGTIKDVQEEVTAEVEIIPLE